MSITSEIRLRVRKEGDVVLNQLSAKLNDLASRSTLTTTKFNDLARTLKTTDSQIRTKSINGLNDYARAWRELANNVDITSKEFRQATREAERFERAAAKAQGRRTTGGLARAAQTAGAISAAGIFGGPEGLVGAGIGALVGGPLGAATGGAIGAQVGAFRQQLGGTATYAADIARQRQALQLVTKDAGEYSRALAFINKTSRELAIPQELITRQFTQLTASVKGAGGNVRDAEKAFIGIASGIRGTGGSLDQLDSALLATSQVFSKGKVSAEELRQQIGERLPGAFSLFAKSMDMTPQELDKALEKGQVSLQDFQKFAEKLFDEYGENAKVIADGPDAAGDRLRTSLSNLSESVGTLLKPIGAAFQDTFAKIIAWIDRATRKLNDFLKSGQTQRLEKQVADQTDRIAQLEALGAKTAQPGSYLAEQYTQATRSRARAQGELLRLKPITPSMPEPEPTSLLPGIDSGNGSEKKKAKQRQDISAQLRDAQLAAIGMAQELDPLQQIALEREAKLLEIKEKQLLPNERIVAEAKVNKAAEEAIQKLVNQTAIDIGRNTMARREQNLEIENTVKKLEIEAGIIDEKQARQIEKEELIWQLQKDGATVTEEQLKRIDAAQARIAEKTSETTQLLKTIGQNVLTSIGDAFESLFTKAQSLRDIFADLLRQTARLILNLGLQVGAKALFPSLFAMGGIMTSRGSLPLKRYAGGGIATSPQLAMFGEGSRPEAYVPLPDGRSIPVTMRGGMEPGNIVVNVDATGTQVQGDQPNANKLGEVLGAAVRAELIRQKRPGGLLG